MGIFGEPVGFIRRDRLYERLAQHRDAVTVVRAPAGFGKTTLLKQYAQDHFSEQSVAWLGLGQGSHCGPAELRSATSHLESPGLLVIEMSNVTVDGDVPAEISRLTAEHPSLSIVILARETEIWRPGGELSRVNQIGASDLLLNRHEVVSLMADRGALHPLRLGAELYDAVAGWPWLTNLLAADIATASNAPSAQQMIRRDVERLVEQGFELSASTRQFAQKFSISHPYHPGGHELFSDDPEHALAELRDQGLIYGGGSFGGRVQVAPALRQAWARQYQRTDPDGVRALHRRLAESALEFDEIELAIHHASLGEDWARATELVGEFWPQVVGSRSSLVTQAVRRIPRRLLLANAQGSLVVSGLLGRSADRNGASEPAAPVKSSRKTDLDELQAMDELAADCVADYLAGRPAQRRTELDAAVSGAASEVWAGETELDLVMGRLASTRGLFLLNQGDAAAALEEFSRVVAIVGGESTIGCALAQWLRILALSVDGDVRQAEETIDKLENPWFRRAVANGFGQLVLTTVEANCAIDRGEVHEALRKIEAPGVLDGAYPLATIELLYVRSRCVQLLNESGTSVLAELERAIEQLENRSPEVHRVAPKLAAALAELRIGRGEYDLAAALLIDDLDSYVMRLARARLLLYTADFSGAAAEAARVAEDPIATTRCRQEALLISARAAAELGSHEDAARRLNEAVRSASRTGSKFAFLAVRVEDLSELAGLSQHAKSFLSSVLPGDAVPVEVDRHAMPSLTRRETEVLEALGRGVTIREIAQMCFLSQNTIKSQVRSLYRKLQASDRELALTRAREFGLIGAVGGDDPHSDNHRDRESNNR